MPRGVYPKSPAHRANLSRALKGKNLKHGHARGVGADSPTYRAWRSMKSRCANPNATGYKHYGGRGIFVCQPWLKFENFLADMGEKPRGLTLDRIDNDSPYIPWNCRWATPLEQARNRGHHCPGCTCVRAGAAA